MRNLFRSPLTWLVGAEIIVVAALAGVAWNVVASAHRPVFASPVVQAPDTAGDPGSPPPELPALATGSTRGPLPGLNVNPEFWRERLAQLNSDQVYLEQLEWRIVHSAEDAANRYLETVVLPAIQHAEHAGGEALA
jgi:hypothetical protein